MSSRAAAGRDPTLEPFTHKWARAQGISRSRLESPEFVCLLRGIFVRSTVTLDARLQAQAALLAAHPQAFASYYTAGSLWGGTVPDNDRAHVSVPPGTRRSGREDLAVHASRRTPVSFRGVRVTSALDTFLDMATCLSLVDLVVLGDSLVRKNRFTPELLVAAAAETTGRGARLARRAAALVRSAVDSPMETRCRLLRVLSGLPELETDIRFYDTYGNLVRRLDSGDRETRTAVEYDGRQHIERERSWEADIGRREEFENADWRILTLVSKDIFRTPGETIERQAQLFRQRGIPVGPRKDEWRRHFRGRS